MGVDKTKLTRSTYDTSKQSKKPLSPRQELMHEIIEDYNWINNTIIENEANFKVFKAICLKYERRK